jgi:hypothetical protein
MPFLKWWNRLFFSLLQFFATARKNLLRSFISQLSVKRGPNMSRYWGDQRYGVTVVRAAESVGEFEESENIQADVGRISSERELSRGLEEGKAEAHREERTKWGSKTATERCFDALYSTKRVGLNTFRAYNHCSSSNKGRNDE